MLKLACDSDRKRLIEFCSAFPLGIRISCVCEAYGFSSPLLSVWYGQVCGEINCTVSLFDGAATVCANDSADFSELSQFLRSLDFCSLCAEESVMSRLGITPDYSKAMYRYSSPLTGDYEKANSGGEYKSIYELISASIPNSFSPNENAYLCWLSDFTFRERRALARVKTVSDEKQLLSCALTAAECQNGAIISGVACHEKARGRHLGQRTVRTLADELSDEGKQVYVIALNDPAGSFYEKTGFTLCGKVSYTERKN